MLAFYTDPKLLYPGGLVTRTGDPEIRFISGRLPDNPGELV